MNPFKRFFISKSGNLAVLSTILMPLVLAAAGLTTDYVRLINEEKKLQWAIDTSAVSTVRELIVTQDDEELIKQIGEQFTKSSLGADAAMAKIDVEVDFAKSEVEIHIEQDWEPFLLQHLAKDKFPLKLSAKATLNGLGKICVVSLEEKAFRTIVLHARSSLIGNGCGVFANSTSHDTIRLNTRAMMKADFICSAGGFKKLRGAKFEPTPIPECPPIDDPLMDRQPPKHSGCNYHNVNITRSRAELMPGIYCGGLKISGTARVKLKPGNYIIKDGPLLVEEMGELVGESVGIYLTGKNARITFDRMTRIKLAAPEDGIMAGILFWEDREGPLGQEHVISSDDARTLLGTIYLPRGQLLIDSAGTVADESAYTAIIVRALQLKHGPTLQLNSDYEDTNVPVPDTLVKTRALLID